MVLSPAALVGEYIGNSAGISGRRASDEYAGDGAGISGGRASDECAGDSAGGRALMGQSLLKDKGLINECAWANR